MSIRTKMTSGAVAGSVAIGMAMLAAPVAHADTTPPPSQTFGATSPYAVLHLGGLSAEGFEFTVEAVARGSITLSYRLGSDLALEQEGTTVEIQSRSLHESEALPVDVETAGGSVVHGSWTLGDDDTVTFSFKEPSTPIAHGGGRGTGAATALIRPTNYWNCVSRTAIGTMASGLIGGCIVGLEVGCAPGALLGGIGGFLGGTVGGFVQC